MTQSLDEARLAVQKAREALRDNNRTEARHWAEKAAALAPQMEDPWLILATVASPRASLEYVQRALKIEPDSPRARKALQWAMQRLNQTGGLPPAAPTSSEVPVSSAPVPGPAGGAGGSPQPPARVIPAGIPRGKPAEKTVAPQKSKRSPLFPILLFGLGCLVCAAAAWSAASSPVVASILKRPAVEATHPQSWAEASIPKPTYTPAGPAVQVADLQGTPTPEFTSRLLCPQVTTTYPQACLQICRPASLPRWQWTSPPGRPRPISITLSYVDDTPTSNVPAAATNAPYFTRLRRRRRHALD